MDRTTVMRRALWVTAGFNFGAAMLFAFPQSLGQLVQLPVPVPPLYAWFCAMVIAVFGGAYAWLAQEPVISRPLVVVAAVGKLGFFGVALACWLLGEASIRIVAAGTGDLLFAAFFFWWLTAK